jgi:hypothetical protein
MSGEPSASPLHRTKTGEAPKTGFFGKKRGRPLGSNTKAVETVGASGAPPNTSSDASVRHPQAPSGNFVTKPKTNKPPEKV